MKHFKIIICMFSAILCASAIGCSVNSPVSLPSFSAGAPWIWGNRPTVERLEQHPPRIQSMDGPSISSAASPHDDKTNIEMANVTTTPTQPAPPSLRTLGPDENLRKLVDEAPGVVLIDFYADWCGPCRKQGAILHELESTASQHRASIIKVDVDQHRALADQLKITSLPTLMLFKDGKLVERKMGVADRQTVSRLLAR